MDLEKSLRPPKSWISKRRAAWLDWPERVTSTVPWAGFGDSDQGGLAGVTVGMAQGVGTFLSAFVARGGWREGRLGLLTALLSALHPLLSQTRARDVVEARRAAVAEAEQPIRLRQVVGLSGR